MIIDRRMLSRMSDDCFREFAIAVLDEAAQRCLLVVCDDKWQLAVDGVVEDRDDDGLMIRLSLEQ